MGVKLLLFGIFSSGLRADGGAVSYPNRICCLDRAVENGNKEQEPKAFFHRALPVALALAGIEAAQIQRRGFVSGTA